ncbi:MAG: LytTR family DNA-binding domain-containing protein [Parvularculaceae bacterium]
MSFERLRAFGARVRPYELLGLQLLVMAMLIGFSLQPQNAFVITNVDFIDADHPDFAHRGLERVDSMTMPFNAAPTPTTLGWIAWNVRAEQLSGEPKAVWLSGPFSAEIYFNGERIGAKGAPGATRSQEIPGPIDSTTAIPGDRLRDGENRLALRYSSHHAGYEPAAVIHSLAVTPYAPDPRVELMYHYAPTLLFVGGLASVGVGLALLARARRDRRPLWLAAGVAGLIVAIAAEVSRSLVNYSYDWHQPRQAIVSAGFIFFGLMLLRFVTVRWPASPRAGLMLFGAGAVAAIASLAMATGYDAKTLSASFWLFMLAILWTAWRGLQGDREALIFALTLLAFPVLALISAGQFIDRWAYIGVVALFGGALLRAPGLLAPRSPQRREATMLALECGGRTVMAPLSDITMLKAAGNYTEVHRDGGWDLDRRGIGAVLGDLPDRFIRIHRSYAVNLAAVASLKAEEGSRYWLTLKDGARLPVGRSQVARLRSALKAAVAAE